MRVESNSRVDRDVLLAAASYGITVIRLLIAVFGALTILRGGDSLITVTSIALIMTLDYFDGVTFDKSAFGSIKDWRIKRRIADSISDRLVIQVICIPLLIKNSTFTWLYLPIFARELVISGYLSKEFAKGVLVYPRSISKIACGLIGITVIAFLTVKPTLAVLIAGVMFTLSAFALVEYVVRVKDHKGSMTPVCKTHGPEEIF